MITLIGTTFPKTALWHRDEVRLIDSIKQQIQQCYADQQNLLINTTWFGPQFNNQEYDKFLRITQHTKFDNLFVLAAADPVFLTADQLQQLAQRSGATKQFYLGHFDGPHYFNFHASILPDHFCKYHVNDIVMTSADIVFVNYNRKPRRHRIDFVETILDQALHSCGIVTLGQDDNDIYGQGTRNRLGKLHLNELTDTNTIDSMGMDRNSRFGIPDDIHSLGDLDIWRKHLLNIVSETEFMPWDNMFISEKTWKPILGLRPFVINGQTKIYQYLRQQGFRTFNHHWPHIDIEGADENHVHTSIVAVIKYIRDLSLEQRQNLYQLMLPDLIHNRTRFFQFVEEQKYKINNLFHAG